MISVVGELEPKPSVDPKDDGELLPQWGIAVVVIGMASLAFVLIFGISMVSNTGSREPIWIF